MGTFTMTGQHLPRVGLATLAAAALVLAGSTLRAQHTAEPAPAPAPVTQPAPEAPAGHGAPADPHATAAPATTDSAHAPSVEHAAPAAGHGAPAGEHGAAAGHGEAHGESLLVTLARIANFASLAGVFYWFGRKPLADHLAARRAQIRKDLVDAAEMKQMATTRLAEIESKLAALPAELDALRTRGAEELASERTRIRAAAEAERDRLVDQARKEIESQTRGARVQLRAHAASLAVEVAEARLKATLTPTEQSALVDQYASQMRNVQ
jgi:F-type H+-transporting ATPase subunit b